MDIGLSVQIEQVAYPGQATSRRNGFLEATMEFADSTKQWLYGFPDDDGDPGLNWIRSGVLLDETNYENDDYWISTGNFMDPEEIYEGVLGGTFAPFVLTSFRTNGPGFPIINYFYNSLGKLSDLASIDLVLTPDKSKWSRCPVFELSEDSALAEGGVKKLELRAGSTDGEQGMGWFPGYAINVETGERLNVGFGEDSGLDGENGGDMLWNPTAAVRDGNGNILLGGKHWIYIFGHNGDSIHSTYGRIHCPAYDQGQWIRESMMMPSNHLKYKSFVFKDAMWVGAPATTFSGYWNPADIPCEVKIRLRVSRPYQRFYSTRLYGPAIPENDNYSCYTFSTEHIAVETESNMAATGALDLINVVPNPYYAWSGYETGNFDNRVKIVNLPEQCSISIYTLDGALVRQFNKNDALTSFDWDLNNMNGKPIAGGLYLIYVKVDGVGEKVVKWFGATQPDALNVY